MIDWLGLWRPAGVLAKATDLRLTDDANAAAGEGICSWDEVKEFDEVVGANVVAVVAAIVVAATSWRSSSSVSEKSDANASVLSSTATFIQLFSG